MMPNCRHRHGRIPTDDEGFQRLRHVQKSSGQRIIGITVGDGGFFSFLEGQSERGLKGCGSSRLVYC